MSELIVRGRHNDHLAIAELLAPGGLPLVANSRVRRIVVDATAVTGEERFFQAAHDSGHQFLVDPQTPWLMDEQPASDSWARLPFAEPCALTFSDLADPSRQERLVADVVAFELDHGATAIIPPYMHLPEVDGSWVNIQTSLWQRTESHLSSLGLATPVLPVLSVDRHPVNLDQRKWREGLGRLLAAAKSLGSEPVGLALSGSTNSSEPALHKACTIWRRATRIAPFIAWNAGDVGPLAVTMGALGYETGLCARETCNVRSLMRSRQPKKADRGGFPQWVGVYMESLNASISIEAARALLAVPQVTGDLVCLDGNCCIHGRDSMLGSGRRQHAARARLTALADLDRIGARRWRLHHLEQHALEAVAIASRVRAVAEGRDLRVGVYPERFENLAHVTASLRTSSRGAVA